MTYILAHRGYRKNKEPDNSITAFQTAIDSGADGFEFDIQLSSDLKFVCYHDNTLQKIGISKRICDLSFKELISLELDEGISIPSLEDVLETFGNRVLLNIELKPQDKGVKELVELINQYDIIKKSTNLIVSSFAASQLERIKSLDSEIPTGFLVVFPRKKVKYAYKLDCDAIHPFYNTIPDDFTKIPSWILSPIHKYYAHKCFKEANQFGLLVNPWTVNDDRFLHRCFERQTFSVITDAVDRAKHIRQDYS